MLIKLSSWSYLEIRMQDEATVKGLIIVPLKWLKSSNIWEQSTNQSYIQEEIRAD